MSQVQDVKNATDIIQLIQERRTLSRSGTNWRGLCPFHSEKSPSFFVNEQFQRYKCFGCGEAGDVFTFLEKYEGMSFSEALSYLAERAGITLTSLQRTPEEDRQQRWLEILSLAKEYYHFLLTQHPTGQRAREYLKARGTTQESIKVFQIGYAPAQWDGLYKFLHGKKKYSADDIAATGLLIPRGNDGYDRFRDRVMFPLTDHRGRVVGFSGRVLDPDVKEAKYINTPETALYHKGKLLYGYSQLYQSIRQANEVVVVEGEFDVISSAQAHVNHVVAVKGSALTEDHMRLLSRTVQKVILSFDRDDAGLTATKRAIAVAQPFGLELRVLAMPEGDEKLDPDELARRAPDQWRQATRSSVSVYEFFLQAAALRHDPRSPEGKRHIIDELAPVFGQISHAVEWEYYVRKLAELLEVSEDTVKIDLRRWQLGGRATTPRPKPAEPEQTPKPRSRQEKLEDFIFFVLWQSPPPLLIERARELAKLLLPEGKTPEHATVHQQLLMRLLKEADTITTAEFSHHVDDDLQQLLFEQTADPEFLAMLPDLKVEKEWPKAMLELRDEITVGRITTIQQELDQLGRKASLTPAEEARQNELLKQVVLMKSKQT